MTSENRTRSGSARAGSRSGSGNDVKSADSESSVQWPGGGGKCRLSEIGNKIYACHGIYEKRKHG